MIDNIRIKVLLCAAITAIFAVLAPFGAFAALGTDYSGGIGEALSPKSVTMNLKDADIRDVLSAIAVNMGNNVVYTGPAVNVSLELDSLSPVAAFEYLLKSFNLTYLQEGNTLIVGDRDTLQNNFSRSLALTRFDLKHITPDVLTGMITRLNLPVTVIMLNANTRSLWVQGFPTDIAKVGELINVVDIQENADVIDVDAPEEVKQVKTLSYIKLNNVGVEEFRLLLQTLGIDYSVAVFDDEDRLYIYATPEERQTVLSIKSRVDRNNTYFDIDDGNNYQILVADKVAKQTAIDAISGVFPNLTIISVDNASTAFLVRGTREDIRKAAELLRKLNDAAKEVKTTFFFHDFNNITSAEAVRRLEGFVFGDRVECYPTTHPDFSSTVFIYCNEDYKQQVLDVLNEIDRDQEKMFTEAVPVFRAANWDAANDMVGYLNVMMGSVNDINIVSMPHLGMAAVYVDKSASIERVALIDALIKHLYEITSDSRQINVNTISFETFCNEKGLDPNDPITPAIYQAYGEWVYLKLSSATFSAASLASPLSVDWDNAAASDSSTRSNSNSDTPTQTAPTPSGTDGDSSTPPDTDSGSSKQSGLDGDQSGQSSASETEPIYSKEVFESACAELDALFEGGGLTATSETAVSDVYKSAENAIRGIKGAQIIQDPDKPEVRVKPTETSEGSLSVSLILQAGGYEKPYDIYFVLPVVTDSE